ncbi:hypothetical protein ACFX13_031968 [Malus domestica]
MSFIGLKRKNLVNPTRRFHILQSPSRFDISKPRVKPRKSERTAKSAPENSGFQVPLPPRTLIFCLFPEKTEEKKITECISGFCFHENGS